MQQIKAFKNEFSANFLMANEVTNNFKEDKTPTKPVFEVDTSSIKKEGF